MKEVSPLRLTEYSHGAGCACKLSPIELGLVLGALPAIADPNVMLGGPRDDAAVYRIAPDRALVATVDFFTPIVDDPTEFGAIAAEGLVLDHAMSLGHPRNAAHQIEVPAQHGGIAAEPKRLGHADAGIMRSP